MTETMTPLDATAAVAQSHTIAAVLTGEPDATLCVRLAGGLETVVLGRKPLHPSVALIAPGFGQPVGEISADTAVTPIVDPRRCRHLLRQALSTAGIQFTAHRATIEEHQRQVETFRHDVRDYAIARRRAGEICLDGLNKFLRRFQMDTYQSKVRVTFTITGSYLVNTDDLDDARSDASYLNVDFDGIDNYDGDSGERHVTVDECIYTDED